ncbi:MAG: response regulator [Rhodocyclaceae bacterium]|nr:response regulator [Rhodocyclaceae bacterium]
MGIKVLLVDELKIMRDGLKALLDNSSDSEVVEQAANGEEALKEAENTARISSSWI